MYAIGFVRGHLKPLQSRGQVTGRLAHHYQSWTQITADPWVLEQVQGHKLELICTPHQRKVPEAPHLSTEKEKLLEAEVLRLLEKGAISPLTIPIAESFISRMFLIPKKDGTMRPIIDLRELNKFVHSEHFKMEGIHLIQMLLQEGDWMVKLDLKDAYYAILIDHSHRKYLAFQFQGVTYQFDCLPFGLTSAPRVFTKIMKPAIAWLRQLGCRMISYIDDNLILASSELEAKLWGELATALFEGLGFTQSIMTSLA